MTPLDAYLYFISPPVLLAGMYAAWVAWREEHRHPPHD